MTVYWDTKLFNGVFVSILVKWDRLLYFLENSPSQLQISEAVDKILNLSSKLYPPEHFWILKSGLTCQKLLTQP